MLKALCARRTGEVRASSMSRGSVATAKPPLSRDFDNAATHTLTQQCANTNNCLRLIHLLHVQNSDNRCEQARTLADENLDEKTSDQRARRPAGSAWAALECRPGVVVSPLAAVRRLQVHRIDSIARWRNVGEMQSDGNRLNRKYLNSLALPRGLQGLSDFSGLLTRLATDVSRPFS